MLVYQTQQQDKKTAFEMFLWELKPGVAEDRGNVKCTCIGVKPQDQSNCFHTTYTHAFSLITQITRLIRVSSSFHTPR